MKTIFTIFCIIMTGGAAYSRFVESWPYDKLTREADFVVIATPISVQDTTERTNFPHLVEGKIRWVDTNHWESVPFVRGDTNTYSEIPAVGVEATFQCLSVLKGDTNTTTFVLHYLRDARLKSPVGHPEVLSINGPVNVAFDPQEKERFLLFLKREPDGRYASVTGQTDPYDGMKDLGKSP